MKKIKDHKIIAGKEFKLTGDTYFTCCDCGLTHLYKFRVGISKSGEPSALFVKAYRAAKLTKKYRGKRKIIKG